MQRFDEYTKDELKVVGQTVTRELCAKADVFNRDVHDTRTWTEAVLDYFAASAAPDVRVDACLPSYDRCGGERAPVFDGVPPRRTKREFMFDLTHSVWPQDGLPGARYWADAVRRDSLDLLLALESENGKANQAGASISLIMEDAAKLLHVAARTKVMVFASSKPTQRDEILDIARRLVARDHSSLRSQSPAWLWLDLPWARWDASYGPAGWLVDESGAHDVAE